MPTRSLAPNNNRSARLLKPAILFTTSCLHINTFSALRLLVGWQEGHPACQNWEMGCWRGYLSAARCRLAYGQADDTATYCLLIGFTFLVLAHLGSPGRRANKRVDAVCIYYRDTLSSNCCCLVLITGKPPTEYHYNEIRSLHTRSVPVGCCSEHVTLWSSPVNCSRFGLPSSYSSLCLLLETRFLIFCSRCFDRAVFCAVSLLFCYLLVTQYFQWVLWLHKNFTKDLSYC